tara:strand:+ start:124 stop:600 length:477 start_codon:yes stop_codon:yes gene_type:complete
MFLSAQSFSGELDGKGIDCELTIIKPPIFKRKEMWWFNNGGYLIVAVYSKADEWNRVPEGSYKPNIYTADLTKYYTSANEVIWYSGVTKTTLNRKNLKIKIVNHYKDEVPELVWEGTCTAFTGFSNVVKRQDEMIEQSKQKKLKRKQLEEKAREGNKI